jgi:hypothetical protein
MLGAFCFGWSAWSSSVSNLPKAYAAAHSATPASSPVTYVTKNIEDVRKGETVVAWDPVTGELGRHEVTNTFARTSDHLRVLEFAAEDDGETQTLETTDEHPFWSVEAGDFVAAGDLRIGNRFISPAGEFSTLVGTHRDEHPEGVPVYNFEVADVHNYYVRAHGLRAPPVRVHNASIFGCAGTPGKSGTALASRSATGRKAVVLGEGMGPVRDAAKGLQSHGINAKWYQAWGKNFPKNRPMTGAELEAALTRNARWIRSKIKDGYDLYDIGADPTRSVRSPFYELEQRIIRQLGARTIPIPRPF